MAIQMIGDNVLIAAVPKEEKETMSDGGIILTSEPKKTASEPGVVIAVGPSAGMIQQGDTVYWPGINRCLFVSIDKML